MPQASLHTIGCRLNQAETAVLADQLRTRGYDLVEFGQPADLVVLNTCSVTDTAEADCRHLIRKIRRTSPDAFLAVTGCYAQTGAEALRKLKDIDLIVGAQHKMQLPQYLTALKRRPAPELLHTRTIGRDAFTMEGIGEYQETRANLKVQDGCNFMCSFCIIPFSRGHERSRSMDDILREAEGLVSRGHREVVLTGVNVGRYEFKGRTLADVVRSLEPVGGLDRIRISSIEPTTITDELLELMAGPSKLCPYLHVPLQSGDDNVLKAMNRRYRSREYVQFIEKTVAKIPDLCLGTDLMVGFPGESNEAFAKTRALGADLPFAYFHVFPYSSRAGTAAPKLPGAVSAKTIKTRARELCELSRAKRLHFYHRFVGSAVSVLFEARNTQGLFTGLTGNYIRVGVTSDEDLSNQIRIVRVHGVMDGLALGTAVSGASALRESLTE
ncbi:MAG: tRNA (N(6)-L-threonylcarbamoyladenosine(37)-C(2))-methylthiotransferase MtaB [Nitrospirae bacterium]|nr:MAG: tRNA (N(6)-L-threonylcarbamoyladenosine(37)-C(2))-methylthiotransferase MtaB [Nitrospirota bacterium]